MELYSVALAIDDVVPGQRYTPLPLHCTLLPPFVIRADEERLMKVVARTFGRYKNVELTGTGPALFGPRKNIPVMRIQKTRGLERLHHDLVRALNGYGIAFLRPQFVGEGYEPHVTMVGNDALQTRASVRAQSVYLTKGVCDGHLVLDVCTFERQAA